MRKLIFINLLAFLMLQTVFGQISPVDEIKYSPNGYFETVFDHYGNSYQLKDLLAGADVKVENTTYKSTLSVCNSGIFELYFEDNWFGNSATTAQQDARKAVICQVFHDLSDFIVTPLKDIGNTTKVKIWVRNINNLQDVPSNVLGLATSFYTMPYNATSNFGGIIDNEIWKTITLGNDSYSTFTFPLTVSNSNQTSSGNFYHGMMAFNFNNFSWNTNLMNSSPFEQYDLYSVVLHEVTHALGFSSLIDDNGESSLGIGYNYFTRYDALLKNDVGNQNLIVNSGSCSMYNYSFNGALNTSILHPNENNCVTDQTTCSTAIKFVGLTNTSPVYTPNCFESGSSLSHFEDQCIALPNQGNNTYFTMSNVTGLGTTKRFLKPEERNTLSDIGYVLNNIYGDNTIVANSYISYGGSITTGNRVAGSNDGTNTLNNTYVFSGDVGSTIYITNLLTNDVNANTFECLQDVFDATANIPITNGSNSTTVMFSSMVEGLHLLRYVPVSISGQEGNISYVYVYVYENNSCAPSSCDLVSNGDFETLTVPNQLPNDLGGIEYACGWHPINNATPDYFHANSNNSIVQVPCNLRGYELDNVSGNNAYAGMIISTGFQHPALPYPYYESIRTTLNSPLVPNTTYQLSFDLSLADKFAANAYKIQAYLSTTIVPIAGYGGITNYNTNMFRTYNTFSTQTDGWQKIVFTFTTDATAGERFLYLGGLDNAPYLSNANPVISAIAGCFTGNNLNSNNSNNGTYYIDNVSLISLNGGSFDLPNEVCNNTTVNDLNSYLIGINSNGIFSGNGVVDTNGIYSFDASIAGVGNHTITYTHTNSNGCEVKTYANIEVVSDKIIPEFDPIAPICFGGIITLPTTSVNFIDGSWSPAVNNTVTTTYTFTPNVNQCGAVTTTLTVEVLPVNDPSCSSNPCPADLTLSTPETNPTIVYKTENWIKANSSYEVDGENVTMKAGDYIVFEPNTHLKAGSEVTALIEVCTPTSKMSTTKVIEKTIFEEKTLNESIVLFPNPVTDRLTIASDKAIINSVIITAMDGKIIYSNQRVNTSKLELDTSSYQGGIYMVSITTINGMGFVKKLVKN
ncbi:T9SS type A sorting domain-containing protein [Flavobacterium sp. J27]|uniref:T9SS type A sorting domain-containing protein n=1 Tax=Flavobacterium sp. J27 TaxID=2060419 RepID=UPI00102F3696|nr:T9SS type A sorting domain-containing protein [Flavobacterium sp. J27]